MVPTLTQTGYPISDENAGRKLPIWVSKLLSTLNPNQPTEPQQHAILDETPRAGAQSLTDSTDTAVDIPQQICNYLLQYFLLTEDEVANLIPEILSNIQALELSLAVNTALLTKKDLLKKIIQKYLAVKSLPDLTEDEFSIVIQSLAYSIGQEPLADLTDRLDSNMIIQSHEDQIKELNAADLQNIRDNRADAARAMDEMFVFNWDERFGTNPNTLSDEVMAKFFSRKDSKKATDALSEHFLTTYFDGAQFGLHNTLIDERAITIAKKREKFDTFIAHHRRLIISALGQLSIIPRLSGDLIYTLSGGDAADLLFRECLCEGDVILVTEQEYQPIVQSLKDDKRVKEVVILTQYSPEAIEEAVTSKQVTYMLVSDVSRFGTIMPLEAFRDVRNKYRETGLMLIVDSCQSIGRRDVNLHRINPDAVIGSCSKGGYGRNVGFLLASNPVLRHYLKRANIIDRDIGNGTIEPERIASASLTCLPHRFGGLTAPDTDSEDLAKMTISAEDRRRATDNLSKKFFDMIRAINGAMDDKIEILHPRNIEKPDGTIDGSKFSHTYECRIQGADIGDIQKIAEKFGVVINSFDDGTEDDVSFRITFHPFMSDESIQILGFVLMQCCKLRTKDSKD